MHGDTTISILTRLIGPGEGTFDRAAAEAILKLRFADEDNARVAELAERCSAGTLTGDDAREYDGYVAAADVLAMLQSKARVSIKQRTSAA